MNIAAQKPDTRKKSYDIGDSQKKIEELRKAMEIPPKTNDDDKK